MSTRTNRTIRWLRRQAARVAAGTVILVALLSAFLVLSVAVQALIHAPGWLQWLTTPPSALALAWVAGRYIWEER